MIINWSNGYLHLYVILNQQLNETIQFMVKVHQLTAINIKTWLSWEILSINLIEIMIKG